MLKLHKPFINSIRIAKSYVIDMLGNNTCLMIMLDQMRDEPNAL